MGEDNLFFCGKNKEGLCFHEQDAGTQVFLAFSILFRSAFWKDEAISFICEIGMVKANELESSF